MTLNQSEQQGLKSAILVHESQAGVVEHCFCTKEQAEATLRACPDADTGASMFVTEEALEAEMVYSTSPDLRARVEAAKSKLQFDIAVRDALNRNGVPADRILRVAVYKAIKELRETVLRPVC